MPPPAQAPPGSMQDEGGPVPPTPPSDACPPIEGPPPPGRVPPAPPPPDAPIPGAPATICAPPTPAGAAGCPPTPVTEGGPLSLPGAPSPPQAATTSASAPISTEYFTLAVCLRSPSYRPALRPSAKATGDLAPHRGMPPRTDKRVQDLLPDLVPPPDSAWHESQDPATLSAVDVNGDELLPEP
jgi:hypothetical protein